MLDSTQLLIDAHVHLYANYDLKAVYDFGTRNLLHVFRKSEGRESCAVALFWLLTERSDCQFFQHIQNNPDCFGEDVLIDHCRETGALCLRHDGSPDLYILAGSQCVSTDGLEVLALCTQVSIPDRHYNTADLIQAVQGAGGVPVLNWAPGKWFLKRGDIVKVLIENGSVDCSFLIGDTPLRFNLWPKPGLMKTAAEKGLKIIAGSDPLPFSGEERFVGSYGFSCLEQFDSGTPVTSIREILLLSQRVPQIIGRRNNPVTFAWREARILAHK